MNTRSTAVAGPARGEIGAPRPGAKPLMSDQQLLRLGCQRWFYVRAGIHDGEVRFVLIGADGQPIGYAGDVESAFEMAAERGLEFVAVH